MPIARPIVSVLSSDLSTETLLPQQVDVPSVTSLTSNPRCCPAVPLNVTRPFWPRREIVTALVAPPTVIEFVTSSDSVIVTEPLAVPCGSITIV